MREHTDFKKLYIIDHPLVQDKLTRMRETSCDRKDFSQYLHEISLLMGYEITRNLKTVQRSITTPIGQTNQPSIDGNLPAIVPILRAGLGMSEGLQQLMPLSPVGHIGLYRDEVTHKPIEYLVKLPESKDRDFILVDPMLATGHSAIYAVDAMIKRGVNPTSISFMALLGAPEGVRAFRRAYADIPIYMASLDERLNENAYIVPGLGDAGDRLFGTT